MPETKLQSAETHRWKEDLTIPDAVTALGLEEIPYQDIDFIEHSQGLVIPDSAYRELLPMWMEQLVDHRREIRDSVEYKASEVGLEIGAVAATIAGLNLVGPAIDHFIKADFSPPNLDGIANLNPLNVNPAIAANLDQNSSLGGRDYGITIQPPPDMRVSNSWQDGTGQTGYDIVRIQPTGVDILPAGGSRISASSINYMAETSTQPISVYILRTLGQSGQVLATSDFLAVWRGSTGTPNATRNFTIRSTESDVFAFSFAALSRQSHLIPFGGAPIPLAPGATSATHDTRGANTCYALAEWPEITDVVCGFPRTNTFPNLLIPTPTLTVVRATETPIIILPSPTRTPTILPITATPTALLGYYTQIRNLIGGETLVKASSIVDPRALQILIDKANDRTNHRPDIRNQLVQNKIEISIIPNGRSINELPEDVFRAVNPSTTRGWTQGRLTAVSEENLLQLPTDPYTQQGIDGVDYELLHQLEFNGINGTAELRDWTNNHYPRLNRAPGFPSNWSDLSPFYGVYPSSEAETFSDIGRLLLKGLGSQIGAKDAGARAYFENILGQR